MTKALNESNDEDYLDGLRAIGGSYFELGNIEKSKEYEAKANKWHAFIH